MSAAAAALIEGEAVYPTLSDDAERVLLELPIELEAIEPRVLDEFAAKGILTGTVFFHGPHGRYSGQVHLTERGARYVLDLLLRLKESALCACGARYGAHNGHPPHDNPETGCRAFTHTTPALVER